MQVRSPLMVGNWKMNGSLAANAALVSDILRGMAGVTCRSAVCVPPVYRSDADFVGGFCP